MLNIKLKLFSIYLYEMSLYPLPLPLIANFGAELPFTCDSFRVCER
jgi:hypothetical protein